MEDGTGNDGMSGVEVAVSQLIAHAGDLRPRQIGSLLSSSLGNALDRLADLDEANPDRIEDQAVGEIASADMGIDRVKSGVDIQ